MSKIPKIKLGKIAKFQQGLQVDVDCQFYSKEENYVQFLRIVDYTNNEEKPRFIEQIKNSPSFVNKNDVVMIRYGSQTAGKVVIGKEGIIANNMFRIIPTINEIEKRYLYYFLKNQTIYNFLMNGQSSSTMPAITFGMMYDVDILLPEIVVQQKIASVLSALDSKIELNNRINAELEAMAKTIYDYWFVQFDFPDKNGKPYKSSGGKMVWNEELKREIPEGWDSVKLEEMLVFEKGIEPGSSEYLESSTNKNCVKFFRVGDIEGQSNIYIDPTNKKYPLASERDVLVTFDGSVGKLGLGINGAFSSGLRKIYDGSKKIDNSVVYFIFRDERVIATIHKYATGSILLHASGAISHLKIPYEEVIYNSFQDIVKPIFDQLVNNRIENQKLAEMRDWLLPMLMNGQVKVT